MSFSKSTLDYIKNNVEKAKKVASALGAPDVTAQGVLGAIGEEYESLGVADWVQAGRVGQYSHEELKSNYESTIADQKILKNVVAGTAAEKISIKFFNPALNDVGPGNIKILTAIDLLNTYSDKNFNSDPLSIKS